MNSFQIIVHGSKEGVRLELSDDKINDEDYKTSINLLNEISKSQMSIQNSDGYLTLPKSFVRTRVYNGIVESIGILDNPNRKRIKMLFLKSLVIGIVLVLILMWVTITLTTR